jgi:hypothetical protein
MGEPAVVLTEEAAAEAAAEQTTRLVVIEGGGGAAAEGGAAEAVATGIGATSVAILAFFLVLLWPSSIAPEPRVYPPAVPPKKPTQECSGAEESSAEKEEREKILKEEQTLKEKCEQLQNELEQLKKTIPKPHPMDTGNEKKKGRIPCSYIKGRLNHMRKLLNKRWEIQNTCFGGKPDEGHKKQIEDVKRSIETYEALEKVNCAPGHPMAAS